MSDQQIQSIEKFRVSLETGKADFSNKQFETSTKILERSSLYYDTIVEAKAPQLEGVKDANERLKIINSDRKETISPELSKEWANLDVAEYGKIGDKRERDFAAIEIANNSLMNKTYGEHLLEREPALYAEIKAIDAENERIKSEREAARNFKSPSLSNDVEETILVKNRSEREKQAQTATATLASISQTEKPLDVESERPNGIERVYEKEQSGGNKVIDDDLFADMSKKPDAKKAMPADIERDYIKVGDKYHFVRRPEVEAFFDKGDKLETKSDSEKVAADLVRIAHTRGWDDIKVTGTPEFRRNVWVAGQEQGLEVKGYTPTEADIALVKYKQREPESLKTQSEPEHKGILVDHGRAPYNFDVNNKKSYFVKLQDSKGVDHVVWGSALQKAIEKSGAERGEYISLDKGERKPIEIKEPVIEDGKVVSYNDKQSFQNTWVVKRPEKQSDHDRMAELVRNGDAKDAVKEDPRVFNAFAQLRVAELISEKMGNEKDRETFMRMTREALAKDLESQKKIAPVVVLEAQKEQVKNKDQELSR